MYITYEIEFTMSTARELKKIGPQQRGRIWSRIEDLRNDPRPSGVRKLSAEDNLWRIRVGDYRVVYAIADDKLIVTITRARHRRDVYR